MSVFVDTAVIMYAAGGDYPLRRPCVRLLEAVADDRLDGVTSAQVIQEILHRFTAIDRRRVGAEMAAAALDLFAPVFPITDSVMRAMPDLVEIHPGLSARDLVHVATCRVAGIERIVSPDQGFDQVEGLQRIDPTGVPGLLGEG